METIKDLMLEHFGEDRLNNMEEISFLLEGKEIGRFRLPKFTSSEDRYFIANLFKIKDFDDYILIDNNGNERARASRINGIFGGTDISNMALYDRYKYKLYLEYLEKLQEFKNG